MAQSTKKTQKLSKVSGAQSSQSQKVKSRQTLKKKYSFLITSNVRKPYVAIIKRTSKKINAQFNLEFRKEATHPFYTLYYRAFEVGKEFNRVYKFATADTRKFPIRTHRLGDVYVRARRVLPGASISIKVMNKYKRIRIDNWSLEFLESDEFDEVVMCMRQTGFLRPDDTFTSGV